MDCGVSAWETSTLIGAAHDETFMSLSDSIKNPLKLKFTPDEDELLSTLVTQYGDKDWCRIASLMGTRNARQCRERYKNYLTPNLQVGGWAPAEDDLLQQKFAEYGAKWNKISKFFVNRSPNALRNRSMMLTRHLAKGGSPLSPIQPLPYSPPTVRVPLPEPQLSLPPVLPITNGYPAGQTSLPEEPFEMGIPEFEFVDPCLDVWFPDY
jgi:hypothetical protein